MLAQRAGLEVEDGIVCDSKLQTSVEGIYAAGDCCSYDSVIHGRRLRVEHWDVAMDQGRVAARVSGLVSEPSVLRSMITDVLESQMIAPPRPRRRRERGVSSRAHVFAG
jgi:NADPH-dependent 2,4-dienoyl-CoA reductase/sulfur reductase-like enzyme